MQSCGACRYKSTNNLWLVLEYCVGGDLGALLQVGRKPPQCCRPCPATTDDITPNAGRHGAASRNPSAPISSFGGDPTAAWLSVLQVDSVLPEASIHDFGRGIATALQYCHSKVRLQFY